MHTKKIVIGITGASGSIYAKLLLEKLLDIGTPQDNIAVIFTDCGKLVFGYELGEEAISDIAVKRFDNSSFFAPCASGSSDYECMIIIPCTMGMLGRIANGVANDLISRTADVMLKERRKLILVTRETPLSLIHLRNMTTVTEAGGIICPANPSYYSHPKSIEQLAETVVNRALQLAGFKVDSYRWEGK
ncbi:MAG: UbiX family flavin prenyltransferase [Prevotellaceae bacterium]|jgi:4-hydroxy-3-polyprenylbenzoate decarboxylase|nr:UbiX family flavin prenyltransferase [Prevotellaceae bacterium]